MNFFIPPHLVNYLNPRNLYLGKISTIKNARAAVKRLAPSEKFLFGDGIDKVTKHLKDSDELNPLKAKKSGGGFRGKARGSRGYGRGGYNNARGGRGGGRGRGGSGNDRVNRFKSSAKSE